MSWNYDEIEDGWLAGSRIAVSSKDVLKAFNQVEQVLGRDWMEATWTYPGGVTRGSSPTLQIVTMGERLAGLENVAEAGRLVEKIRLANQSAIAELTALFLLRRHRPEIQVELFPRFTFNSRMREADFGVRQEDEPWTFVEVTQPDFSAAQLRRTDVFNQLTGLAAKIDTTFTLEIFLTREPSDEDMESIVSRLPEFCKLDGFQQEELPAGLGILAPNPSSPGLAEPEGSTGSRLILATSVVRGGKPRQNITIRTGYSDVRAAAFLQRESAQLPDDGPGLIMVDLSRTLINTKSWVPLVRGFFQPSRHEWVSAVCLFATGFKPTENGLSWLKETNILLNPHCRYPLPPWVAETVENTKADFEAEIGPSST